MNRCSNKKYYNLLHNIAHHFYKNSYADTYTYDNESHQYKKGGFSINSIFDFESKNKFSCEHPKFTELNKNEIDKIKYVLICNTCYNWIQILNPEISDVIFEKYNPLKEFWKNTLTNYLLDDFEFQSIDDYSYICDTFYIDNIKQL